MPRIRLLVFVSLCGWYIPLLAQKDTSLIVGDEKYIHVIYQVQDTKKPMVILQSGARSHAAAWNALIPMLTEAGYSYLAYDRPGLGESASTHRARDGAMIAMELRSVLKRLKLEGDMILVGHSMGGVYQAIYNDFYPENIKGLIMIDSPNGEWENGLRSCLTDEQNASRDANLQTMRAGMPEAVRGEYEGADTSFKALKKIKLANQLIIISGGAQNWPEAYDAACLDQAWSKVQQSQLLLGEKAQQLISTTSGHGIPYQDPQIIMQALKLID